MSTSEIIPTGKFTKPQLDLLRMFSVNVPEEDWEAIREHVKLYFAEKATTEMDKLFEENKWTDQTINDLLNTHMRTPYNK